VPSWAFVAVLKGPDIGRRTLVPDNQASKSVIRAHTKRSSELFPNPLPRDPKNATLSHAEGRQD